MYHHYLIDDAATRLYRIIRSDSDKDIAVSNDNMEAVRKAIEELKEKYYEVIVYRFGLFDGHPCDRLEVAKILGVTCERVLQLEAGALRKLRKSVLS